MESNTRLIDITAIDLELIVEKTVKKVLDARLPKPDPKYFTVMDLQKIIGCSRPTIYKLKNEGKLPYRRIKGTRKIRFIQEDIDNFLLQNPGFGKRKDGNEKENP